MIWNTSSSPSAFGSSNLNFLRGRVGEDLGELLGEGRGDERGERGLSMTGADTSKCALSFPLFLLSALCLLLSFLPVGAASSVSGSVNPRAARLAARRSLKQQRFIVFFFIVYDNHKVNYQ